jgi:hypothetical protein
MERLKPHEARRRNNSSRCSWEERDYHYYESFRSSKEKEPSRWFETKHGLGSEQTQTKARRTLESTSEPALHGMQRARV